MFDLEIVQSELLSVSRRRRLATRYRQGESRQVVRPVKRVRTKNFRLRNRLRDRFSFGNRSTGRTDPHRLLRSPGSSSQQAGRWQWLARSVPLNSINFPFIRVKKNGIITTKDIARQLHISVSTVARALKDAPDVRPETRQAVLAIAADAGYRPNSLASSLSRQQSRSIGVVVPDLRRHFFSDMMAGIEDVAYAAGYKVLIGQSTDLFEREVAVTQTLLDSMVDGLLVAFSNQTQQFDHLTANGRRGVPLVLLDRVTEGLNVPTVTTDDYAGAFAVVSHLAAVGCRRIAYLTGPLHLSVCQRRKEGYEAALCANGLVLDPRLLCESPLITKASGYEHTQALLSSLAEPPDALFCSADTLAIGGLRALHDLGYKVPAQIAVAGFGNEDYATYLTPSLTTIEQSGHDLGKAAAELLLDQLNGQSWESPPSRVLSARLLVRESTQLCYFLS